MEYFKQIIGFCGYAVEALGVVIILAGVVQATLLVLAYRRQQNKQDLYTKFRQEFARAMLVGLEFLVAGDIIRTVVVSHSLTDISSLGLLVLIRTVLVFTLHLELHGQWPWQKAEGQSE